MGHIIGCIFLVLASVPGFTGFFFTPLGYFLIESSLSLPCGGV